MKLSFQRLMVVFTLILSLIICTITGILVAFNIKSYYQNQQSIERLAITKLSDTLENETTVTNDIASYISENQNRINSLTNFLQDSPSAYAKKTINQGIKTGDYFNWPQANENFYVRFSNLQRLSVQMNGLSKASYSDISNTYGRVWPAKKAFQEDMVYGSIISPAESKVVGLVGTNFDKTTLYRDLNRISNGCHLQLILRSDDGRILYHFADKSVTKAEKLQINKAMNKKGRPNLQGFTVKREPIDQSYFVYTVFNNKASNRLLIWKLFPFLLGGLIVLGILVISFTIIFRRYRNQLNEIIKTTKLVGNNNLKARVKLNSNSFNDLTLLSTSINGMLDDINDNIDTIYKMRIAQQDAHMKSLQAQISPHFMANTLEYIRMSALDMGDRDLAKVVYSFASLLRSNVGNEIWSTLKKEVKLVKNYIYLYQVRFPDKLAYQINIDPRLNTLKIPKFTLQPIVENYFAHGVNFANNDNVIKIECYLKQGRVLIQVIDNGRKIDVNRLSKLNLRLQEPIKGDQSIGLQNVYARMNNYTQNFKMMIINNRYGGVTVRLSFDYKE